MPFETGLVNGLPGNHEAPWVTVPPSCNKHLFKNVGSNSACETTAEMKAALEESISRRPLRVPTTLLLDGFATCLTMFLLVNPAYLTISSQRVPALAPPLVLKSNERPFLHLEY